MPEGMERSAGVGDMAQMQAEIEQLKMMVEALASSVMGGEQGPPRGGPPMGPPPQGMPPGGAPTGPPPDMPPRR